MMSSGSLKFVLAGVLLLCLCIAVVPVNAAFTINTVGAGSYYLGDDITLYGTADATSTVYLFLTGPNMPSEGAQIASIDPASNPVIDQNELTFLAADVPSTNEWWWTWKTEDLSLDAGTYTVYALTEPRDINHMTTYATSSIVIKKPFYPLAIEQGATIFIGEQGLDVTHALNSAYGKPDPDGDPAPATIGLFSSYPPLQGFQEDTPPGAYDLTPSYNNFAVNPAEFVGYTGNWWAVIPGLMGSDHMGGLNPAFVVADPSLDMQIWNYNTNADVTDTSVPRGTQLKFRIETNLYAAIIQRSGGLGNINIKVKDPDGVTHNSLYNDNPGAPFAGPYSLFENYVDTGTWYWGESGGYSWQTAAVYDNQYIYPSGTYTIWAESALNGMKDNYKDGVGADYAGKTVSPTYTVTIQAGPVIDKPGAVDLVIDNWFGGSSPADVSLSVSDEAVPPGSTVELFPGDEPVTSPADYPSWAVLIDDNPEANWGHACRIVFVNDEDQYSDPYERMSPPTKVRMSYAAGVSPPDPASAYSSVGGSAGGAGVAACTPDCSKYYALLISGGVSKEYNYARYWNDISSMYIALTQTYGYPKDHVYVLMSDGANTGTDQLHNYGDAPDYTPNYIDSPRDLDNTPDTTEVNGNAKRSTIITVLGNLDTIIDEDDNLFIFVTNHGGNLGSGTDNDPFVQRVKLFTWGTTASDVITDTEFVNALPSDAKSVTLMMEQCFGGGFIDNFRTKYTNLPTKAVIMTAAKYNEYSWGDAFSYPWINGVYNPLLSDTSRDGRASMSEAFIWARKNDAYYLMDPPKETPQLLSLPSGTGTSQFLADCIAVPTLRVTDPNTQVTWYTGESWPITWIQSGLTGTVNIELWKGTPGTMSALLGTADVTVGKKEDCTIPSVATGTDYYIKIITADGLYSDRSDANIIIYPGSGSNTGTIRVTSVPLNADIWVDNRYMTGTTPYSTGTTGSTTLTLQAGSHDIGASCVTSLATYYPITVTSITIPNGGSAPDLNFQLDLVNTNSDCDPYGRLYVSSTPQDTQESIVRIDGIYKGLKTDGETMIAPGSHTVSAEHDGYLTASQTVNIPEPDCALPPEERAERITYADFTLSSINPVTAKVKIVPKSLNLASKGYFVAFVTLPSGYKAADVMAESVKCEGAPALKLIRIKMFPYTFVTIFRRQDLRDVATGDKVTMDVEGVIKKTGGNVIFRGSDVIKVINKKVTAKEAIDNVMTMKDEKIFSQFNPG